MNWKFNAVENIVYIVVMFLGLGAYTSLVLKPILITAIQTETSKIENNIKTDIDNKFKKIDELKASIPFTASPENTQNKACIEGFICIMIKDLTNKQKRQYNVR